MKFFNKSENAVSINTETIIKVLGLTVMFMLLIKFIGNVTHQLTLVGVAAFLAMALNPAVVWITHKLKSKSRTRATGFAYLIVLSVLAGLLWLVVPPLVQQTSDFIEDIPETIESFKTQDSATARFVRRHDLNQQLDRWSNDLSNRTGDLIDPALNTASRALSTVVSIITVLVLTFMMLVEGPMWFERLLALQPEDKRQQRRKIAQRMYRVVTGYVNGQVLIAAIAASFSLVALLIGNVLFDASVNAVALAGITFVFGLIPLIGNILGAAIIVLMTLFVSTPFAIAVAVFFLVYQQIENITIQPYIQSRGNQLTPLMVFVAALLGAGFGGLLGALAAIPIAGCLRILLEEKFNKQLPADDSAKS